MHHSTPSRFNHLLQLPRQSSKPRKTRVGFSSRTCRSTTLHRCKEHIKTLYYSTSKTTKRRNNILSLYHRKSNPLPMWLLRWPVQRPSGDERESLVRIQFVHTHNVRSQTKCFTFYSQRTCRDRLRRAVGVSLHLHDAHLTPASLTSTTSGANICVNYRSSLANTRGIRIFIEWLIFFNAATTATASDVLCPLVFWYLRPRTAPDVVFPQAGGWDGRSGE